MERLYQETTQARFNLWRAFGPLLERKRVEKETRLYGSSEERQAAYSYLDTVFTYLFDKYAANVTPIANQINRLEFLVPQIGFGILSQYKDPAGKYQLHLLAESENRGLHGHLSGTVFKHEVIVADGVTATLQTGVQDEYFSDNWSPKDGGGYWDTFDRLSPPKPLRASTAKLLASELTTLPESAIREPYSAVRSKHKD